MTDKIDIYTTIDMVADRCGREGIRESYFWEWLGRHYPRAEGHLSEELACEIVASLDDLVAKYREEQ